MLAIALVFASRLLLVMLFLPFSAFDKLANFRAAVGQAETTVPAPGLARAMILAAICAEVLLSACVLTGYLDRLAAFLLAGYCVLTALLWKRFWREPDFRLVGPSDGREVFWDFLKNLAVAGGFLAVTFGATAEGARAFLADPLASSLPYSIGAAP